MHTHVHTYVHTCTHIHAHTYTHVHTYMHTHVHTYMHTHVHTYMHTRTHMYTHTCTHMYTHICTHMSCYNASGADLSVCTTTSRQCCLQSYIESAMMIANDKLNQELRLQLRTTSSVFNGTVNAINNCKLV